MTHRHPQNPPMKDPAMMQSNDSPSPGRGSMAGEVEKWAWWAGDNEEEYRLAGPCPTREHAIGDAYGDTEPGDYIYLVEAVCADEEERDADGIIPFVKMRNQSFVIREEDEEDEDAIPKETPDAG